MWSETRGNKTRYHERYTDPMTGKVRVVSFTLDGADTRKNRKLALEEINRLIDTRQTAQIPPDLTFGSLMDKYISYQKKTVKMSTWTRNEKVLRIATNFIGKDVKIDKLTAAYIRDRLLSSGKKYVTLNEYIRRIKAMLRWAYDSDYLQDRSCIDKLKLLKENRLQSEIMKPEDKYLEPEQLSTLLDYMQATHEEWYNLTRFLALSGLRIGEAIALDKDDITDQAIIINKNYDLNNDIITSPKTPKSNREVDIQPELAEVIRQIRRYYRNRDILTGIRTNLFFSSPDGSFIKYGAYNKYIRELTERILGTRRTPHSFRHTHASLLFAEGVSIDTISRRLGHENSKVTREIYLHVIEKVKERDREAISKIRLLS